MRLLFAAALLLAFSTKAVADEKIGDWTISFIPDGSFAYTQSDSGGRFGIICTSEHGCQYFVNILLSCEEEAKTPFLVAGEAGTLSTDAECVHLDKTPIMAFSENLDNVVFASGNVGVATAMDDGKFKVMRFSMKGAIPAIAKAKGHVEKRLNTRDDGYSDTVL